MRIIARNTIDERMVQIQRDKLRTIGTAVRDHDSSRMSITGEELASLFGRVVKDAEGKVIGIERDYRDEEEEEQGDEEDETAEEGEQEGDNDGQGGQQGGAYVGDDDGDEEDEEEDGEDAE